MTRDDLMPIRKSLAPPDTQDEAVERVSECCEGTMLGLVGSMFLDIEQLRKSLRECKIKGDFEEICDSGAVKTWRGFFFDPGGNSFEIIANAWSEHLCQVMNVRFATAAMDTDPEAVKRVHKTMKGE